MEKAIIPVGFASEFIEEKINFGESVAILSGAKKKAKTNESALQNPCNPHDCL